MILFVELPIVLIGEYYLVFVFLPFHAIQIFEHLCLSFEVKVMLLITHHILEKGHGLIGLVND